MSCGPLMVLPTHLSLSGGEIAEVLGQLRECHLSGPALVPDLGLFQRRFGHGLADQADRQENGPEQVTPLPLRADHSSARHSKRHVHVQIRGTRCELSGSWRALASWP